ncbi:hypothetical protein LIA77_04337 [Sarocladium implicatum]|nr:hypothetical protein LIA77_04337 [Sarocladium implicatum]
MLRRLAATSGTASDLLELNLKGIPFGPVRTFEFYDPSSLARLRMLSWQLENEAFSRTWSILARGGWAFSPGSDCRMATGRSIPGPWSLVLNAWSLSPALRSLSM